MPMLARASRGVRHRQGPVGADTHALGFPLPYLATDSLPHGHPERASTMDAGVREARSTGLSDLSSTAGSNRDDQQLWR